MKREKLKSLKHRIKCLSSHLLNLKNMRKIPTAFKVLKLPEIRKMLKYYKSCMIVPQHNSFAIKSAKKAIRKMHDFALVGNKKVMLQRLIYYFEQEKASIVLQKYLRGFFDTSVLQIVGACKTQSENMCQ